MSEKENIFQQWEDLMNDPEFESEMIKFFEGKEAARKRNMERMKRFFNDDESFEKLLIRVLEKHDDRWTSVCRAKNVEPHPFEILYAICHIVEEEGTETGPLDALTENFQSTLMEYRGYTFAWTNGQGTVLSIYDKNKELIFRD